MIWCLCFGDNCRCWHSRYADVYQPCLLHLQEHWAAMGTKPRPAERRKVIYFNNLKHFPLRPKNPQKFPVSGLCARRLRPAHQHFSFLFFFAIKQCPIATKIAGSIGILPRCVLQTFSQGVYLRANPPAVYFKPEDDQSMLIENVE